MVDRRPGGGQDAHDVEPSLWTSPSPTVNRLKRIADLQPGLGRRHRAEHPVEMVLLPEVLALDKLVGLIAADISAW